jgi:hypothetical protein
MKLVFDSPLRRFDQMPTPIPANKQDDVLDALADIGVEGLDLVYFDFDDMNYYLANEEEYLKNDQFREKFEAIMAS